MCEPKVMCVGKVQLGNMRTRIHELEVSLQNGRQRTVTCSWPSCLHGCIHVVKSATNPSGKRTDEMGEGTCQEASLGALRSGRGGCDTGQQHDCPEFSDSRMAEAEFEMQLRDAGELNESNNSEKFQRPTTLWQAGGLGQRLSHLALPNLQRGRGARRRPSTSPTLDELRTKDITNPLAPQTSFGEILKRRFHCSLLRMEILQLEKSADIQDQGSEISAV